MNYVIEKHSRPHTPNEQYSLYNKEEPKQVCHIDPFLFRVIQVLLLQHHCYSIALTGRLVNSVISYYTNDDSLLVFTH